MKKDLIDVYREDWVFFIEHALGHKTWSKQREIIRSVQNNRRTAVRACHGASKTYTAAEIAVLFFNLYPTGIVVTTAPTGLQVEKLLWTEIGRIYNSAPVKLVGDWHSRYLSDPNDPKHYAIGFSTDKPQRAEGWHADHILIIIDEAKGVAEWAWDAFYGATNEGFTRILAISTTDGVEPNSNYDKCFKDNSTWNKIAISAYDTPDVTGEKYRQLKIDPGDISNFEIENVSHSKAKIPISGKRYIKDGKADWGEDSVLFKTKVEGKIVDGGESSIIKLSQTTKMFNNTIEDPDGAIEVGVDVARGGSDDTVMWMRHGMKVLKKRTITSAELPATAKLVRIVNEIKSFVDYDKSVLIKVDDTGVGGGVTDMLQDDGYNALGINFGGSPKDTDKYSCVIDEMWFEFSEICDEIDCPQDDRLELELTSRKYDFDKKGRRVVEPKKKYKKRMNGKSPDCADAFLLCFYEAQEEITPTVFFV